MAYCAVVMVEDFHAVEVCRKTVVACAEPEVCDCVVSGFVFVIFPFGCDVSRKYFSHLFSSSTHLPPSLFPGCFGPMPYASTISNSLIQPHPFLQSLYIPRFSHTAYSSTLKMEAKGFSETLAYIHKNTGHSLFLVRVHEITARN
jgi:hypothetical protein